MNASHEVGIEWVVAAVAPWTLSPHPNFAGPTVRPAEVLALITEMRYSRERARYEFANEAAPTWAHSLLDAAQRSLGAETQRDGCQELWQLADRDDLDVGARVAAALYASLAATELEEADCATRKLDELIDALTTDSRTASHDLALGVLAQQRVLRLFDTAQFAEARREVQRVLALTPRARVRRYEAFAVSEGVRWGATRVQRDIAAFTRSQALAALSSLEFLSGRTWIEVVRSRRGWIDYRARGLSGHRDSLIIRDAFENKFEGSSDTQHFMRRGPVEAGYEALLWTELAGSTSGAIENREALAKTLVLQSEIDDHHAREAIRLLRQAGATKPLQSVLTWFRNEGPVTSILDQARLVLRRTSRADWVSEADLLVLEAASEFLEPDERAAAISVSFKALETEILGGRAAWSKHDMVWKAVGRLAAGAERDDFIATRAYEYVARPELLSEPLASRLARVLASLDWHSVRPENRNRWRAWALQPDLVPPETAESASGDLSAIRRAILTQTTDDQLPMPPTVLERAVVLAESSALGDQARALIDTTARDLAAALVEEADQARRGIFSFGGYSTSEVAVVFALRFQDADLWSSVTNYLTDPDVDASLKSLALERLARSVDNIPNPTRMTLRDRFELVLTSPRRAGMFRPVATPFFAEALRLGGSLGVLNAAMAVESVIIMATGDTRARIEAAKTATFVMNVADPTWVHGLLLQLSMDNDPHVRAEAAISLVRSLRESSSLMEHARRRVMELLRAPGARVPFATIQALRAEVASGHLDIRPFKDPLNDIAASDAPRVIADAARLALTAKRSANDEVGTA